jgi:hypothetical protein
MAAQRQTASPPQADQPSAETLLRKGSASLPDERNYGIRPEPKTQDSLDRNSAYEAI